MPWKSLWSKREGLATMAAWPFCLHLCDHSSKYQSEHRSPILPTPALESFSSNSSCSRNWSIAACRGQQDMVGRKVERGQLIPCYELRLIEFNHNLLSKPSPGSCQIPKFQNSCIEQILPGQLLSRWEDRLSVLPPLPSSQNPICAFAF